MRNSLVRDNGLPAPIRQMELVELILFVEPAKKQNELRASVIERLDQGADVEPGEYSAQLHLDEQRPPTWKLLESVLDRPVVDRLRDLAASVPIRRLRIRNRQGNIVGWGAPKWTTDRGYHQQ